MPADLTSLNWWMLMISSLVVMLVAVLALVGLPVFRGANTKLGELASKPDHRRFVNQGFMLNHSGAGSAETGTII
jgi:hypothetical protein